MALLLIAALPPETKALKQALALRPLETGLFQAPSKNLYLLESGMGEKKVKEKLSPLFEPLALKRIINIGFAGALTGELSLFDLLIPSRILRADRSFFPEGGIAPLLPPSSPCDNSPLFTASTPVLSEEERAKLARTGAKAVDMEAAFILELCEGRNLPCHVVKVISDTVDLPDLKPHIGRAGAKLRDTIVPIIDKLDR